MLIGNMQLAMVKLKGNSTAFFDLNDLKKL